MKLNNKDHNCILSALSMNAAALLASLIFFKPFFEENDDAFISMIAEGAYGTGEVHLIYPNIILGYIYKVLYTLCHVIRWHSVLQYVFLFAALTLLTYIIQKQNPGSGRFSSALVILSTFYEAYVSLQYSKTVAFVCVIGYILLLYCIKLIHETPDLKEKSLKRERVIIGSAAFVILIYGMLLRDSSFMLASLLLIPVGIYVFFSDIKKARSIKPYFALFGPVLLIFIATWAVNKHSYDSDPAWKTFMEYNSTRMQLQDFRYDLLDYNKYGDELEGFGVSENDAILYLTWQFGDDTVLTTEKMKEILGSLPARRFDLEFLKHLVQHIYEDMLVFNPLMLGVIIMFAAAFLSYIGRKDRGRLLLLLAISVIFAGILVYYEYSGRWTHRIVYALLLAFLALITYIDAVMVCPDEGAQEKSNTPVILILVAIACLSVLLGNRFKYNEYKRSAPSYREFYENMAKDKDTLYIADTFTFQYAYRYDVFRAYKVGSLDNYAAVGSWFVNSPLTKRITGKYDYVNPYRALAGITENGEEGGNVLLADNMYLDEKLLFLKEHYGEYRADEAGESFGISLYRIEKK